ncbi:MAG: hypothetical protein RIF41_38565, partial [Polyangiaceae bacterium]
EQLKEKHKGELAIIVHDAGDKRMTLRLVDAFLPKNLNDVYPALNNKDPFVDVSDGNVWGGSGDIGGSPRKSGSGLSGRDVLGVVAEVLSGADDQPTG